VQPCLILGQHRGVEPSGDVPAERAAKSAALAHALGRAAAAAVARVVDSSDKAHAGILRRERYASYWELAPSRGDGLRPCFGDAQVWTPRDELSEDIDLRLRPSGPGTWSPSRPPSPQGRSARTSWPGTPTTRRRSSSSLVLWVSAQGRRLQLTPQIGRFPGRAGTRPTDPWASVEFATSVRLPSFKHAGPNRRGVAHESCRLRPRLWREDISPRGPLRGRSLQRLLRAALSSSRRLVIACCVRRGRLEMSEMLRRFCGDVICDPLRKGHTAQLLWFGR
jgi:hypothetical protein